MILHDSGISIHKHQGPDSFRMAGGQEQGEPPFMETRGGHPVDTSLSMTPTSPAQGSTVGGSANPPGLTTRSSEVEADTRENEQAVDPLPPSGLFTRGVD